MTEHDKKFVRAMLDRLDKYGAVDGGSLCRLFQVAGQIPSHEYAQDMDAMFRFTPEESFALIEKIFPPPSGSGFKPS
jgi:hypothetical protein